MADDKLIFSLGELILVLFVFLSLLGAIVYITDQNYHVIQKGSKDIPLYSDAVISSPHNINASYTLPNATKLIINQMTNRIGVASIKTPDNEALLYPYIKDKNIANLGYVIKQPEENNKGEFNITLKNE